MARDPSFDVTLTADIEPGETLLIGMAGVGVAGLTATDYLVTHVETAQIGHVETRNLPDITPFSDGKPRNPIRLYSTANSEVTVLISELFLPVWVADPLADALLGWVDDHGIEEIGILYGAPFPHSEEEHRVFHVGTEAFRRRRLADGGPPEASEIGPLAGGFFDGVVGELMIRSLNGQAPPAGVFITPTHLPGPDFDAAIRLLETLDAVYGITVDERDLRDRADEMDQYYRELTERMQALQEGALSQEGQEYPIDRMYM